VQQEVVAITTSTRDVRTPLTSHHAKRNVVSSAEAHDASPAGSSSTAPLCSNCHQAQSRRQIRRHPPSIHRWTEGVRAERARS